MNKSIDKDLLYDYYKIQNHTEKETAKYFNISKSTVESYCKKYGIHKNNTKKINKDELYTYYIKENHTLEETGKYFNKTVDAISHCLRNNKIYKIGNKKDSSSKKSINHDELYDFYIVQNHTIEETAKYFNKGKTSVGNYCRQYGFFKKNEEEIGFNELYDYYIKNNHKLEDTAKYFNKSESAIRDYCKKYNFYKTREQKDSFTTIKIDKNELYNYYIVENHSTDETAKHFNIHERTLRRKLSKYGIVKSVELQVKCSQENQIKKYGKLFTQSDYYKEKVVDKMVENTKKTCLKKYGVESVAQTKEVARKRKSKYLYNDLSFDSKWELYYYIYSIDHGYDIKRCPCTFEYKYKGKIHVYIPDFQCNGDIIEIKGEQFFKNGKFTNPFSDTADKLSKAKYQCMIKNKVVIMREKDLKYVFEYIEKTYGKDYGKQFKK